MKPIVRTKAGASYLLLLLSVLVSVLKAQPLFGQSVSIITSASMTIPTHLDIVVTTGDQNFFPTLDSFLGGQVAMTPFVGTRVRHRGNVSHDVVIEALSPWFKYTPPVDRPGLADPLKPASTVLFRNATAGEPFRPLSTTPQTLGSSFPPGDANINVGWRIRVDFTNSNQPGTYTLPYRLTIIAN